MSHGHRKKPTDSSGITSALSAPSRAPGQSSRLASTYAPIQRKETGAPIADRAEKQLGNARAGSGAPLPAHTQADLGNALGTDLSHVRVHDDGASNAAATSIGAKAYTEGQDIHFAAGKYAPATTAGQRLLAHEVAHTVQQRGAAPSVQSKPEISAPGDGHEREADAFADSYVAGRGSGAGAGGSYSFVSMSRKQVSPGSVSGGIHRAKDPDADFEDLSYGEQESLFRAAPLEQQVTYFFSVSRFNRRYTLFTSLEPIQQARLIPRISVDDRRAFLEQLPVSTIAYWYRDRLLNAYHQQIVYLSMSTAIRQAFIAKMAGRVADLVRLISPAQRSELISLIPANFFGNFFDSCSGTIADLYASVPSDMKQYVFAMMPADMQTEVAVDTAAPGDSKPAKETDTSSEASNTDALARIESALAELPADVDTYTSAVDRLDAGPLSKLGRTIAKKVERARSVREHSKEDRANAVAEQLSGQERTVANSIGPNRFRGRSVLGRSQDQLPKHDVAGYIAEQTTAVVELISTVLEVKELLGDEPAEASESARTKAVSKVELWRSSFLYFQFVRRVLTEEGLYAGLRDVRGSSGAKLADTAEDVVADWRRLGKPSNDGPWYVMVGRAIEAGVELLLPDPADLPELALRSNPLLVLYDAGGYMVEAAGDATGLYDYEHDGQSAVGQAVEPIARNPEGAYDAAVEGLSEHFLRIESGDPEAIGQSVAILVSLLVPGAEEVVIAGATRFADDLARAAKQLRKLGLDEAAEQFLKHEDEVRGAVGKVHGSGDGVSVNATGSKKPDAPEKSPGVAPDSPSKTADGGSTDTVHVDSTQIPPSAEAELANIEEQLNNGQDSTGKRLSGKAKRRLRERKKELKEQLGESAPKVSEAPANTPTEYKERKPGQSGKEAADDIPSWVEKEPGPRPGINESGKEFARRMMDGKYGVGEWTRTGQQGEEFSQIKKFGDRAFE